MLEQVLFILISPLFLYWQCTSKDRARQGRGSDGSTTIFNTALVSEASSDGSDTALSVTQTRDNSNTTRKQYKASTEKDDIECFQNLRKEICRKKANQTLGFLKRNIRVHNKDLKSTAYKTLVRPQLEYASTVWSPHTDLDINKLESIQHRAARWVTRDYQYTSSVSKMLQDLNWRTLDQRRIDSRLVLLYKVTYDLVAIPASDYLIRNTRPSSRNHPIA